MVPPTMTRHKITLVFIILLFINTNIYSEVIYKKQDYSEAQSKLDQAEKLVPELFKKKKCSQVLEKELGWNSKNQLEVLLFIVDDFFFGINPRTKYVDLMPWDNSTRGNNVCADLKYGGKLNYINIDSDVLLLLPVEEAVHTLLHETIHAMQCQQNITNHPDSTSESIHTQVQRIMSVCYAQ